MGELGELLELLHGARRRYRTVGLEAREWRHNHRLMEAHERLMRASRGTTAQTILGDRGETPAESEVGVRIWLLALDPAPTERPPLLG